MKAFRRTNTLIVVHAVLGVSLGASMLIGAAGEPGWQAAGAALLATVGAAGWGLWRRRRWAFFLSHLIAASVLGLGLYAAHFAWTFWLFTEPTLWDRLLALLRPAVLLLTLGPLSWLIFFTRPRRRLEFLSRPRSRGLPPPD